MEGGRWELRRIENEGILGWGVEERGEWVKVRGEGRYMKGWRGEMEERVWGGVDVGVRGSWVGGVKVGGVGWINIEGRRRVEVKERRKFRGSGVMSEGWKEDMRNVCEW